MVAGWRLARIDFVSPRRGLGIAAAPGCARVRLAVSRDAGAYWRLTGAAAPGPVEAIVALTDRAVWLLDRDGTVETTDDGGARWSTASLPTPTVALVAQSGWVDALGCRPTTFGQCRPTLARTRAPGGPWRSLALPATRSLMAPEIIGAGGSTLLFAGFDVHSAAIGLWVSDTGGARWAPRPAPSWDGRPCTGPATMMATGGRRDWWLLCLTESHDAGAHWSPVLGVRSEDRPTELDVLSARRAWLLVSGAGLWRTDDGWHWQPLVLPRG